MQVLLFIIAITILSACSKEKKETKQNQFANIIVSKDYLLNDECSDLANALTNYLFIIQHRYNESDKKSFSSFKYTDAECIDDIKTLEKHQDDKLDITDKKTMQESLIKLRIINCYLRIEKLLSEKELLVSSGNKKSSEWFTNLDTELNNIYEELSNGIQE